MSDKIISLIGEWQDVSKNLINGLNEMFILILNENNKSIDWEEVLPDLPETVTVSFDGGNHPEYASNVFSTVYGVKLCEENEKQTIYFNIEDDDEYCIDRIPLEERLGIYQFMLNYADEIGIKWPE